MAVKVDILSVDIVVGTFVATINGEFASRRNYNLPVDLNGNLGSLSDALNDVVARSYELIAARENPTAQDFSEFEAAVGKTFDVSVKFQDEKTSREMTAAEFALAMAAARSGAV